MPRDQFEKKLQNEQRAKELRKLNDALKHRADDDLLGETPPSTKLAEAILRPKKSE